MDGNLPSTSVRSLEDITALLQLGTHSEGAAADHLCEIAARGLVHQ
jgi:hypothetical protein